MATDHRIRTRIAQRLGRTATDPQRIDLDPHALDETIRTADAQPNVTEQEEQAELDRDSRALHASYLVREASSVSRRRLWAPLIRAVRRFSAKVLWPVLDQQSSFNAAATRSVSNLMNRTIRHDTLLRQGIGTLTPTVRAQARAIHDLERRIRMLEHDRAQPMDSSIDELAFANRFRGTEEAIRDRQRKYIELFAGSNRPVLDFGSGRGEFLELLQEAGIPGHGVDTAPGMVEHSRAKGLAVELRDGFAYLEGVPPGSLGGVFASQVLEHLNLPEALSLLRLSRRALAEDGVLLLETHNPQTFLTYPLYAIDPTHVRLYHHETVAWLLEQEGFASVEIRLGDAAADAIEFPETTGELAVVVDRLNSILHGFLTYAAIGHAPRA